MPDWNDTTREEAFEESRDPLFVYFASKALAEKEVWKFAKQHPEISVTSSRFFANLNLVTDSMFSTVNTPLLIGPYAPGMSIAAGDVDGLSSNIVIYNMLSPDNESTTSPVGYVDVRDVAASHIAGLQAHGRNRALLTGEWFELKDAFDYIATVRPVLRPRLPTLKSSGRTTGLVDNEHATEMLGISAPIPWRETILETIDAVVGIEKSWIEQGVDVEVKLKHNRGY